MQVKFYETDPVLKDHILMFAFAELSVAELSKTKFLPDNATSLTLFLNVNPTVRDHFTGDTLNYRITFSGQYSKSVLYTPAEDIRIINVDFLPWGAYSIFGIEQSQLHNITSDATLLFPELKKLLPDLENHLHDDEYCVRVLEKFLLDELQKRTKKVDERIIEACQQITENLGKVQIKELCKSVGMSHSGLTNYFTTMIGVNPKLFGRVARFTAVQNSHQHRHDAAARHR